MKLKPDLHDVYNGSGDIDRVLRAFIDDAVAKEAPLVEIIPGKGRGARRVHVAVRVLHHDEIADIPRECRSGPVPAIPQRPSQPLPPRPHSSSYPG